MSRAPVPSTLSLAILGLVSIQPRSGYDLRKIFSTTPMGHFSTSPGAIYPALRRLERNRLVKSRIEKKDTLRPKQIYVLTKKGKKELEQRLSKPVIRDDVIWRLDELMLRFAFMGHALGQKQSLDFLRELVPHLNEYVRHLKGHLKMNRVHMTTNGAYAMEQGIAKYQATARWAKRVTKELQR
ncbi:MAG: PadR family transcriptional regulator [Candidatus Latescibacterota bacterium]|nr:MAG: PadR family transcriptional regulator [Candidatus Latescibacterota bacterium]